MNGGCGEDIRVKKLTIENIDAVLAYLPYFENTKNVFFTTSDAWIDPIDFSLTVIDFIQTAREQSLIVLDDLSSWREEAIKYYDDPGLLKTADLDTLRKLLTLLLRGDMFCGSHLANMIECGLVLAILRRLKTIRDEMNLA